MAYTFNKYGIFYCHKSIRGIGLLLCKKNLHYLWNKIMRQNKEALIVVFLCLDLIGKIG